jgi:hypothetical protein
MSSALRHDPQAISFTAAQPGETFMPVVTVSEVPFDCDVSAHIIGTGLFKVLRVIRYEVERGPNGQPLGIEPVDESDGSTPLSVSKGDLVETRLLLTAGTSRAFGTLIIGGRGVIPRTHVWNIQVQLNVFVGEKFWITDVEVIQSVQTPNNAVPLIGHKPTFVRVYVQSAAEMDVTAVLVTTNAAGPYELKPLIPILKATPQGSQRKNWSQSLNFRLDDELTSPGLRDLRVTVSNPLNLQTPPSGSQIKSMRLQFSERIDLVVYGVVWSVKNNNDGQGAPIGPAAPWSDFEGHRRYVENVYPVSTLTIQPVPGIGTQAPKPQPFGNLSESRAWATQKLQDLPARAILNLLDNWDTGGLHGLAWDDRACEEQNARDIRIGHVMAQEVAHCLGLGWHTFTPGSPYPRSDGRIGDDEICLDLSGPQPAILASDSIPIADIMSYGLRGSPPPKHWASAFTYLKLLEAIKARVP